MTPAILDGVDIRAREWEECRHMTQQEQKLLNTSASQKKCIKKTFAKKMYQK